MNRKDIRDYLEALLRRARQRDQFGEEPTSKGLKVEFVQQGVGPNGMMGATAKIVLIDPVSGIPTILEATKHVVGDCGHVLSAENIARDHYGCLVCRECLLICFHPRCGKTICVRHATWINGLPFCPQHRKWAYISRGTGWIFRGASSMLCALTGVETEEETDASSPQSIPSAKWNLLPNWAKERCNGLSP